MKRGQGLKLVGLILSILSISSVVNADIVLTVNGLNPSVEPLELKGDQQIIIGLSGEAKPEHNKYDLSIVATGGTLEEFPVPTSEKYTASDTIQITTDSLDKTNEYIFSFTDTADVGGLAVVDLITNTDMTIDGVEAAAGTKIYELIIFELPEK